MAKTDFDERVSHYIEKAKVESPTRLLFRDIGILFRAGFGHVLDVVLPLRFAVPLPGMRIHTVKTIATYFIIILLAIIELLLLVSLPIVLFFCFTTPLPVWFTFVPVAVGYLVAIGLCWALASLTWRLGPKGLIVNSQLNGVHISKEKFIHEKWIFINGIATSHSMLQNTCDMLASKFRRPITGIHNRSFGIIGDLLECLIQRAFSYATLDVRVTYEALNAALQDDEITKLVVIAHSQGGILVSLAMERLYSELPVQIFRKLEIYTFGSAASRFKNPLLSLPSASSSAPTSIPASKNKPASVTSNPSDPSDSDASSSIQHAISHTQPTPPAPVTSAEIPNHYVPVIEHYANALDLIPRWGVLYHADRAASKDYSGRVFVRLGASGHLIDQHYIEAMFGPLDRKAAGPLGDLGPAAPNGVAYLDYRLELGSAEDVERKKRTGAGTLLVFNNRGGVQTDDATKSMLELSRLWRYLDGREYVST